ncbi:MAG: hypothetical protein CL773_00625 [Chloroflexi bacterium]|nr:hypothetical protein [Chloroflexota bacterium]|tara:strand:- start:2071 stop:2892 length:822 start_codon:yes stop_codon:yes gene_type:complete
MIDILVIGNPTLDYIEGKFFGPGGAVTYVNNSLFQMGQSSVTIITSFGEDFSEKNLLSPKKLINIKSELTNKFDFHLSSNARDMQVSSEGRNIKFDQIELKTTPEIIFISPVLYEISIDETKSLMNRFQSSIFVGMPQGWIRKLENKKILFDFSKVKKIPYFDILFFSEEEITKSKISKEDFIVLSKILVITKGDKGADIYFEDQIIKIEPIKSKSQNTIGAGDIFASVFSIEFFKTNNLLSSGNIANEIAAKSTEYSGLKAINSDVFNRFLK